MKTEIPDDYPREQKMSALMLTSSHAKKGKRVKGQRLVSKEIRQCQADLSVLGNLSHWRQSAAMEKNKISPFIVSSFSSPKRSQIWENFFPLLSTCTYDVSEILLNLLSQGISWLSLIIRHIFIHGLWGLISTSGPQNATLKSGV